MGGLAGLNFFSREISPFLLLKEIYITYSERVLRIWSDKMDSWIKKAILCLVRALG